ncbi:hypothetical protein M0Q97_02855 [Candidatus Dojkabacteria bacterium]|jgi:hypothetical protein|nr:hypothetical protein [Candidatus Dojkabacteria bacterium]
MIIGNSGCNIEIKNNILTKTSTNILYNDRLIKQMNKQISFNKNMFKTPTVLSNHINTDTDLFSFDMNYINGYDSIDYFNIIGKYEIDLFLDKIYTQYYIRVLIIVLCKKFFKNLPHTIFLNIVDIHI